MAKTERSLWVRLGLDTNKYKKGVKQAKTQTQGLKKMVGKLAATMGGVLAVKGIVNYTRQTIKATVETKRWADRLGIGVESLQELQYAGKQFGIQNEAMIDGLKELTLRTDEFAKTGSGPAAEVFERIGITAGEAEKLKGNTEGLFNTIIKKVSQVQNTAARQRIADELFGGQGGEQLTEMISAGGEALEKFRQEARRTGSVVDSSTAQSMEELDRQFTNAQSSLQGIGKELVVKFMPTIKNVLSSVQDFAKWIKNNTEAIKAWIKTIGKVVTVFAAWKILQTVVTWIRGVRIAFTGLNTAMKANVIIGIISALYGLYEVIKRLWKQSAKFRAIVKTVIGSVVTHFKILWVKIKQYAASIWDAIKTYFGSAGKIVKAFVVAVKQALSGNFGQAKDTITNAFSGIVNDFKTIGKEAKENAEKELADIKMPDFQKIMGSERALQMARKAGYDSAEEWQKAIKEKVNKSKGKEVGTNYAKGVEEGAKSVSPFEAVGKAITKLENKIKDAIVTGGPVKDKWITRLEQLKNASSKAAEKVADVGKEITTMQSLGTGGDEDEGPQKRETKNPFGNLMAKAAEETEKQAAKMKPILQGLENAFMAAFSAPGAVMDNFLKALKDFALNMIKRIAAMIAAVAVLAAILAATGLGGLVGASNPANFKDIIGGITGEGGLGGIAKGAIGLADGGTTKKPGTWIVGENGPETVTLPSNSTVTPLGKGAGGGGIHITLESMLRGEDIEQSVREVKRRRDNTL